MEVVASGRIEAGAFITHRFSLDDIVTAYPLFAEQ